MRVVRVHVLVVYCVANSAVVGFVYDVACLFG